MTRLAWFLWERAWHDEAIPDQQLSTAELEVAAWLQGEPLAPFDALSELIVSIDTLLSAALEIGCSSGYYAKIFDRCRPHCRYFGIDYSSNFCVLGRERFPSANFVCADTLHLPIRDSAFPLVVSGSVLLHVKDWRTALRETLRVTSDYAILHRTPVVSSSTEVFTKRAYGRRLIEWCFNEDELLSECNRAGFYLTKKIDLNRTTTLSEDGFAPNSRSYLLMKK